MKVLVSLVALCVLFGFGQAIKVTVTGDIENYKFIDRELVYAAADPVNFVSKGFTFPPKGIAYGTYVIKGIKQIDETDYTPKVEITSGGIGHKHVMMIVTSEYAKRLGTTFQFYGEKVY